MSPAPGLPDWMWIQNVVFPIMGMAMATFVLFGLYRIANRWLDRRHERQLAEARGGADGGELAELRQRVDALEDVAFRVQELEERVDFAERVLAQRRESSRLPGAGGV